ncbi:Flp pilus assembly protein CpaB [Ahrensia sp. 13_GOM-1096m]|uniref:Flp pilus assembly protein CpaB n=1 Tax=Ahrensia sp. 13_GOM-1096m TaxID=1380380 RepID=UPI00047D9C83|nr:Flp pilus assembly protein CpaB [Ahrensia sp. 13_GOM-1096m]
MSMRFVILGVAVLAAGGAGYLAMNLSAPAPAPIADLLPSAPSIELDQVLVAKETILTGGKISGGLGWQQWPVEAIAPDFITESSRPEAIAELEGSIVRSTIIQGEPVRPIKILGADQSFMSSILPAGKRAVATTIAADTSAGGFILPDDYVDVIMTTRDQNTNAYITETILANIRVLAIDQTIREDENGQLVQVGQTATLELTPNQTKIISVAQQMADRLTLALRSIKDIESGRSEPSADHLISGGTREDGSISLIKNGEKTMVQSQ